MSSDFFASDSDADNIDRDPDSEYRRRPRRTDQEPDEYSLNRQDAETKLAMATAPKRCFWPGVGLVVTGLLSLLGSLYTIYSCWPTGAGGPAGAAAQVFAYIFLSPLVLGLIMTLFTILGGCCLLLGRGRNLVVVGAVLACIPLQPVFLLGIPMAIWVFNLLGDEDITKWFARA